MPAEFVGGRAIEFDLPLLMRCIVEMAPRLEGRDVDTALVRAQLADRCRDMKVAPLTSERFTALTSRLDAEAWRRVALCVSFLRPTPIYDAITRLVARDGLQVVVLAGMVALARDATHLPMSVLRSVEVRREEFARHFVQRLNASVAGESPAQSREKLQRLDSTRLTQDENARAAAEANLRALDALAAQKVKT